MEKTMRKSLVVALILAVTMVFSLPYLQVSTQAYGATAAVKAAQKKAKKIKKAKLIKVKGKWFFAKNKKLKYGIQTVGGKYYNMKKGGGMVTGVVKIKGHTYNFVKIKSGKKKGQAPAMANKSKTISGVKYYFSSKGRGFVDVGNAKGNKAVGKVMDSINFTNKMSAKNKLKKAYTYVINNYSYLGRPSPTLDGNGSWIGETAFVMADKKSGKCFNYGAIVYELAKACGIENVKIVTGQTEKKKEHCWVTVTEGEKLFVLDAVIDDDGDHYTDKTPHFFYVETTPVEKGKYDYSITVNNTVYNFKEQKTW